MFSNYHRDCKVTTDIARFMVARIALFEEFDVVIGLSIRCYGQPHSSGKRCDSAFKVVENSHSGFPL